MEDLKNFSIKRQIDGKCKRQIKIYIGYGQQVSHTSKWNARKREQRKWRRLIFENIMAENFPELTKGINPQIQEHQQIPSRINKKKTTLRHFKAHPQKSKEKNKILRAATEKEVEQPPLD